MKCHEYTYTQRGNLNWLKRGSEHKEADIYTFLVTVGERPFRPVPA